MRRRIEFVSLFRVILIALAITAILAAPVLADPAGKVKGVATGLLAGPDPQGNVALYNMHYIWNIHQVDESGTAKGFATTKWQISPTEFGYLKVEYDCVQFGVTDDGRSEAIYSGKIVRIVVPDWWKEMLGDWEGRLKIGRVIDGGPDGEDEVIFWSPLDGYFYPDEGTPLGCVVPEGSQIIPFVITGGDVEVRMP